MYLFAETLVGYRHCVKMVVRWQTVQYWTSRVVFILFWVPFWFLVWVTVNTVPGLLSYVVDKRFHFLEGTGVTIVPIIVAAILER